MTAGFASVTEDNGVVARSADVNGFTVSELVFPPGHDQPVFEPELPYLAVVLGGELVKSFRRRRTHLARATGVSMPAGAAHGARFGPRGARILVVRCRTAETTVPSCLAKLANLSGPGLLWPASRLAGELHASDTAAPLAVEGLALELLAAASRAPEPRIATRGRTPRWLTTAEELLRTRIGDRVGLGELAAAVDVHPSHLARAFRERHGLSVGEYGRRVRLDWAATELLRAELPLAVIAAKAGFADQSHFTRLFARHVGTTPARYRELASHR